MPSEPEVLGLLALMLHCEARRDARRSDSGAYIPLSEQDVARWSGPMIEEAERLLERAAHFGRIGHFQLEAAIQSVHAHRAQSGQTDWESIAMMYEALVRMARQWARSSTVQRLWQRPEVRRRHWYCSTKSHCIRLKPISHTGHSAHIC